MARVAWHLDAIDDLEAIAAFIERGSSAFAASFVHRITDTIERLGTYPHLGRVVPELHDESYRELIFQSYRIVYRLVDDDVVVIGVVHGAMDMELQIERREWRLP